MPSSRTRLLVGATLGLLLLGSGGVGADDDAIEWVPSYAEGRRVARETGRPLMVVFR